MRRIPAVGGSSVSSCRQHRSSSPSRWVPEAGFRGCQQRLTLTPGSSCRLIPYSPNKTTKWHGAGDWCGRETRKNVDQAHLGTTSVVCRFSFSHNRDFRMEVTSKLGTESCHGEKTSVAPLRQLFTAKFPRKHSLSNVALVVHCCLNVAQQPTGQAWATWRRSWALRPPPQPARMSRSSSCVKAATAAGVGGSRPLLLGVKARSSHENWRLSSATMWKNSCPQWCVRSCDQSFAGSAMPGRIFGVVPR